MSKNPICPLFDEERMTEDEENYFKILFSKKSRRRLESPDIFEETHYPIEVYHENEDKLITEDEFFKRVFKKSSTGVKEEVGPHCSIIIGDNGVGKSELCAYVYVKLKEQGYEDNVLYIDKYKTLKDIISEKIPAKYESLTGNSFELMEDSEFIKLGEGKNVYSGEISGRMLREIDKTYGTYLANKFSENKEIFEDFKEFISESIERVYGENNPIAHDNKIFENENVRGKKWFEFFSEVNDDESEIIKILDQTFDDCVYEITNTPSISKALEKLSMDTDDRMWIIFEDYDLRPMDNKQLLDFIESNAPVDIEFVIAMTPDRENKLDKIETGTFRDRNDFYKFQRENKGIPFFNEETINDFIEPFLSYLKNTDKGKSVCKNCGKCDDEIIDLYPFSTSFIKKLYKGFRKDPTPRKYVELISDLLDDFRSNYIPPYNSEILGHPSYKIEADIPPDLDEEKAFVEWYYGEETSKNKMEKLAQSLNLNVDDLHYEIKDDEDESSLDDLDESKDEDDDKFSKLKELTPQIRNWIQDPTDENYSECNSYIRQGVLFLAKNLTDNWRIDDPWTERKSPEVYYHISRSEKVHFEKDDFNSDIIFIPLDLMTFKSAKSLLKIGYKTKENIYENFDDIAEDEVKNTIGLVEYGIKEWRRKIIEDNFDKDMSYAQRSEKKLDDLIAFSVGLFSDLINPFDEYTYSDFDSIINDEIKFDDDIIEYFSTEEGFDVKFLYNKTKSLLELFRWRFAIDGKSLSPTKYNNYRSSFKKYFDIFSYFKKTEAKDNVSNKFRIGSQNTKMGNMLEKTFIFVERLVENNLFSDEEYINVNEIENFYENVVNIDKNDFERISTLSYLEGTDVLASIESYNNEWNEHNHDDFLGNLKIYENTSSVQKDFQNIILKKNYFYEFYIKITSTEMYKEFKDEDSYSLSEFLDYLEEQNEIRKKKERQEKVKRLKKEIKDICGDLKNIKDLEKNQVGAYQIEDLEKVNDLSKLKDIKTDLLREKEDYFDSQEKKLEIFKEYQHFFEKISLIKELDESIKNTKNELSKENLKRLIEKREKLEKEFENIFDFINSENRYRLAKDNKVILTELSSEEIEKLKKSQIKDSIYLVIES